MANGALIDRVVCLSELSKDLEGELRLLESEKERCKELDCTTLETVHQLELKVARHDCDSDVGSVLDGTLHSGDLVHKFVDGAATAGASTRARFAGAGVAQRPPGR